jgi:aminoglycoside 6'-N-acetyltransferase
MSVMHSSEAPLLPQVFLGARLRRLRQSDLAAFQAYRSIPELGRFQAWLPMSETNALTFLLEMNGAPLFTPGTWVQLGIAESETDHLIGDIGLFLSDDGLTGTVGFTLAPSAQGRGIATSAVRQAVQVFFRATRARQLQGITDSRNAASIRLLERVGFRYHETRSAVFRGEECSEKTYLLSRTDQNE